MIIIFILGRPASPKPENQIVKTQFISILHPTTLKLRGAKGGD